MMVERHIYVNIALDWPCIYGCCLGAVARWQNWQRLMAQHPSALLWQSLSAGLLLLGYVYWRRRRLSMAWPAIKLYIIVALLGTTIPVCVSIMLQRMYRQEFWLSR